MEGFGQTESTLIIGNLAGEGHKIGSMGKPVPLYRRRRCWTRTGKPVEERQERRNLHQTCEHGWPVGLFRGYYRDEEKTERSDPRRLVSHRRRGVAAMRTASSGMWGAPTT